MTRVDLTKAQCAELANYLRGVLNNGMGAGSFDKIEMLVLARRALASFGGHARTASTARAALCTEKTTAPAETRACRSSARLRAGAMWRKCDGATDEKE